MPDFPRYFDSSMLSAALACERQFDYSYLRHLQPKAQSIHLTAGGAFAAGLEAIRTAYYLRGASIPEAMGAGFRAAVKEWGDYEPEFPTNKSLVRVLEALANYITEWWPLPLEILTPHIRPGGEPSVEWSFSIDLPEVEHPDGGPLFYVGRLDMLAEYEGQLFAVDEKTTSQMGASWTKNWDLRGQFTGYVWAAQTVKAESLPVAGAVVRGVAFRTYDFGHAEVITLRPQWLIEQWLERTLISLERLKKAWASDKLLPNFDTACTNYGGCRFYDLCTKRDPEPWIEGDFEVRPWNPLHR